MVHYPMEAFQSVPIADSKVQLLEILKAKMRCLLRRSLLDHGFFSRSPLHEEDRNKKSNGLFCNFFFVLQACEKFLSLRKGTKSDVTAVLEEAYFRTTLQGLHSSRLTSIWSQFFLMLRPKRGLSFWKLLVG
ncbi:ADP-ribosylation factor GTPase-activating protein AGD3-like isoform X3 [Magnolia sinica]|uniref:ADP-ribosylation factor GTPase-activating protein AGD3-like isoform X3 n=1 Tax=Magnolia sinica TaxID=86752 RepID=UPI002657D6C2|nr:ADP-ribosylation factor GTPase-activating protein AGD3-like isoform X3 [Magnolia sinica]